MTKIINTKKALKICTIIYATLFLIGLVLTVVLGPKLDINFSGGTKISYSFEGEIQPDDAKKAIEENSSDPDYDKWFKVVLNQTSSTLRSTYPDFPVLFDLDRPIKRLPFLKMKHTDKKGTPERPHYKWDNGIHYLPVYMVPFL